MTNETPPSSFVIPLEPVVNFGGNAENGETRARWVERAARPLFPAARRKHFAQRTQTVNRAPRLPPRRQMPDAGRVGQRAGRPFHPTPTASAAASACICITGPDSQMQDRL